MANAKVMVVEDEIIVAREIQGVLKSWGYAVPAVVSSGEEAIKKAGETRPDLVLMDIILQGDMDGIQAAEQIRVNFDIPIVYLTAYTDEDTLQRAKMTEPYSYSVKPLNERELRVTIEVALQKHKMDRMLQASRHFLQIANRHTEMAPLLKEFVAEVKNFTGCAAVGIRILDEEGNISYRAYEGFSQEFYESENPLSIKSDQCMCINVIKGETNPKLPFYTEGGSFYMNATTRRFLATVSEEEKGQTRNVCSQFGYKSVALIPILIGDCIIGLIHVADSRENMVPLDIVEVLEGTAMQLGVAIHRVQTEEELRRKAALDQVRASVYSMREPADLQNVITSLQEALKEDMGVEFDNCSIQILDDERNSIKHSWWAYKQCHYFNRPNPVIGYVTRTTAFYKAWQNKQVVYRRDLVEEDPYDERQAIWDAYGKRIRSVLDVPFSRGTVAINSMLPDAFSEADLEALKQLAGVLSEAYIRFEDIQRVEESEEKYRSIVEHSRDIIFRMDAEGNYLLVSPAVEALVGYSPEEFHADRTLWCRMVPAEYLNRIDQAFEKVRSGEVPDDIEYQVRSRDGRILWVSQTTFPIKDSEGQLVAIEGTIRDITNRKRTEEQIKASLKEKEVLLKEIHHRVKNNLQVISSILDLQADYTADEQIIEIFNESKNRIRTMALVHEFLYQSKDLARIDFAEYIQNSADTLFGSYDNSDFIQLRINVEDDISLNIDEAIPCGLIINELISNSLKHAFPAGEEGKICIDFRSEKDKYILIIDNNGVDFPKKVDFRNTESLGLQLVVDLTEQLDGTIELDRSRGTTFKITFPQIEEGKKNDVKSANLSC